MSVKKAAKADSSIIRRIKMKYTLSARNQFEGKVVEVNEGAVNGIVKIELDIAPGVKACAVIKATDVMVGK